MRTIPRANRIFVLGLLALASITSPLWPQESSFGLGFATVLGGPGMDRCDAVDVDHAGFIYLGCRSDSPTLPTGISPPYWLRGDTDGFVIKLAPNGGDVQYLAHFGGSSRDGIEDIAVDSSGYAHVVGYTHSASLFITGSQLEDRRDLGARASFVARISPDGDVMWFSYLGGSGDRALAIAVDTAGNVYVTGSTRSSDFATTSRALQRQLRFLFPSEYA